LDQKEIRVNRIDEKKLDQKEIRVNRIDEKNWNDLVSLCRCVNSTLYSFQLVSINKWSMNARLDAVIKD